MCHAPCQSTGPDATAQQPEMQGDSHRLTALHAAVQRGESLRVSAQLTSKTSTGRTDHMTQAGSLQGTPPCQVAQRAPSAETGPEGGTPRRTPSRNLTPPTAAHSLRTPQMPCPMPTPCRGSLTHRGMWRPPEALSATARSSRTQAGTCSSTGNVCRSNPLHDQFHPLHNHNRNISHVPGWPEGQHCEGQHCVRAAL